MAHLRKAIRRLPTYALRGRIGRDERRVRRLQLAQFPEERIIFRIANRRASLDVIASIMFLKFQPELGDSVVR